METTQKKGRPWYQYALSLIPFFAGLIVCILLGIKMWHGLAQFDKSLVRVVVPGEKVVVFDKPGAYTIFHENKTVIDGVVYSSSGHSISGLSCKLKIEGTGEDILLKPSSANLTYSFGSREGTSLFDFSISKGGAYRLNCLSTEMQYEGAKTVLAVGRGFGKEVFSMISFIFGIITIFLVSFSATAAIIIYLVVKKPAPKVSS